MTVTPKALYEAAQLPTANTTIYTAPVNTRTLIDKMTGTNTTAGALTLTVFIVPAAGAAGAGNTVVSAQSIAGGASYLCPEVSGHVLNPGDFIVTATSGLGITGRLSGREVA